MTRSYRTFELLNGEKKTYKKNAESTIDSIQAHATRAQTGGPQRYESQAAGVGTASSLPAATPYSRQDALAFLALGLLVAVSYLPAMLWGGFVWDDNLCIKTDPVREVSGLWQIRWLGDISALLLHWWWPSGTSGCGLGVDHWLERCFLR